MRVIKIDPYAQRVHYLELEPSLEALYAAINCRCVDIVPMPLNSTDCIYVDDEALFQEPQPPCFLLYGRTAPVAGIGIVVGSDEDGNDIEPDSDVMQVLDWITFVGPQQIKPTVEVYPHS